MKLLRLRTALLLFVLFVLMLVVICSCCSCLFTLLGCGCCLVCTVICTPTKTYPHPPSSAIYTYTHHPYTNQIPTPSHSFYNFSCSCFLLYYEISSLALSFLSIFNYLLILGYLYLFVVFFQIMDCFRPFISYPHLRNFKVFCL